MGSAWILLAKAAPDVGNDRRRLTKYQSASKLVPTALTGVVGLMSRQDVPG